MSDQQSDGAEHRGRLGACTSEELARGLELWKWAKRIDPEAADEINNNWVPMFVLASDPEQDRKFELVDSANRRLRHRMLASLAAKEISLAIYPSSPKEPPEPILSEHQPEIVQNMAFVPISPNKTKFGEGYFDVRVYSAERQKSRAQSNKGKGGRPPKWDWDGATRFLMEIAHSPNGFHGLSQAELVRRLRGHFIDSYELAESPSDSQLKNHIKKICSHLLAGN